MGLLLLGGVGWFVWFLRSVQLLQMSTEINKGFYGLGPLNQAAAQAGGISVSFFTGIQTESSITITWVQCKPEPCCHPKKSEKNGKMPQIRYKLSPKETEL